MTIETNIDIRVCREADVLELDPNVVIDKMFMGAGPAFCMTKGGRVLACGGLRVVGVAEAWAMFDHARIQKDIRPIIRTLRATLWQMMQQTNCWEIFAVRKGQDRLLEHMGFKPLPNVYVRGRY